MAQQSRGILFRKRTILGTAVVAGLCLGIYLGQFKGFGLGGGWGLSSGKPSGNESDSGKGSGNDKAEPIDGTALVTTDSDVRTSPPEKLEEPIEQDADVVRVVIDDRQYLLQTKKGDRAIKLEKLIELVQNATGDQHGVRLMIYEKMSARPSAEENLKTAIRNAQIEEGAVIWAPGTVK